MKELNEFRLLAGIPIDGSIEITEKKIITESAKDAAIKDFWCVKKVTKADTKLSDCLRGTNTQGLCHMIRDASDDECDDLLIFAGGDKASASKEAKKRIRGAQKAKIEAEEEAFFQKAEQEYEEEMDYDEATVPDLRAERDEEDTRDVADEMRRSRREAGEDIDEGIETVVAADSWEDDDDKPVNVVDGNGKKTAPFKDIETVDNKENSTDAPKGDKNESPQQLRALDTPSEQDQSGGNDHDRKLPCPARIKALLKTEADEARDKAKKLSISDREDSYFYDDLANAFEDLYNHLDGGTVYDIKKAQIFMTSLMGPMLHKIPADVVNWIAKGGQQRSLKSYMIKVDDKYPITGPRNALN